MDWYQRAEHLYRTSTLGRRQSQVAILTEQGCTPTEMQQLIAVEEEDAPSVRTLQSTASKLHTHRLHAEMTVAQLAHGYEDTKVPLWGPSERDSRSSTAHYYMGDIGSGKTVTLKTHVTRLLSETPVDQVLIIDPIGSWDDLVQDIDQATHIRMSSAGFAGDGDRLVALKSRIQSELSKHKTGEFSMIVVEDTHYLQQCLPEVMEELLMIDKNVSLRLSGQTIDPDLMSEIDVVHIHQTSSLSVSDEWFTKLPKSVRERIGEAIWKVIPHLGRGTAGRAPGVLTVFLETGETRLRMNVLTEAEAEKVLPGT